MIAEILRRSHCCCGPFKCTVIKGAYFFAIVGIAITVGEYYYINSIGCEYYLLNPNNITWISQPSVEDVNAILNQTGQTTCEMMKMNMDNPKMFLFSLILIEFLQCLLLMIGLATKLAFLMMAYLFVKLFIFFLTQCVIVVFYLFPLIPIIWAHKTSATLLTFLYLFVVFLLYDLLSVWAYFTVYRAYRQVRGRWMVQPVVQLVKTGSIA